jgi:protein arginine kinase activator
MKCEICHKNDAAIHFKQVMDGETHEMFICRECAKQNGLDPQSPMDLTDFLFGVGVQASPVQEESNAICPTCHMRPAEFRKNTRLGCPDCYDTFHDEVADMLRGMHRGERHQGKIPSAARLNEEIAGLRRALHAAVAVQDFEEAAKLRDRIRELQTR